MAVKTLCVNLDRVDSDSVCSLYNELRKIPCLFKYSKEKNEFLVTAQERYMARIERVVAQYV